MLQCILLPNRILSVQACGQQFPPNRAFNSSHWTPLASSPNAWIPAGRILMVFCWTGLESPDFHAECIKVGTGRGGADLCKSSTWTHTHPYLIWAVQRRLVFLFQLTRHSVATECPLYSFGYWAGCLLKALLCLCKHQRSSEHAVNLLLSQWPCFRSTSVSTHHLSSVLDVNPTLPR